MRYKIAYLTSKNPLDKNESSGIYYYQSAALKKYCGDVHYIGPVNNLLIKIIKKISNILQKFTTKKYNPSHSILISYIYGHIFTGKLGKQRFDFVFAEKSSSEIAFIKTGIPVIYSTDATFNLLNNYYSNYSNLFRFSENEGNFIEQRAVNKASLIICSSKWAVNSIINDYRFPSAKTFVIPRGANIDSVPEKEKILERKKTDVCRLLFIGRDWYRKGFDIAYETMKYIRSQGMPVKLTVAGSNPPEEFIDKDVEVINYIDKNRKEGKERFDEIMINSDFFLLPVRAECVAVAFCEAAAYGLPVITRDTGGIKEVVVDGITGFTLDYKAGPEDFGKKIIELYKMDEEYYELSRSSRNFFEERLNWDAWGKDFKNSIDSYFKAPF